MSKAEITMDHEGIVDYIAPDGNGLLTVPKDASGFTVDALMCLHDVKQIVVEAGNPYYRAESCCLIDAETETVVYAGENALVPDGVKALGHCAFNWDDDRTSMDLDPLRLPDGLQEIGYRALAVTSDKKIRIIVPASVECVGLMAFMMKCGGDKVCEVTFLGDTEPSNGMFGTERELCDVVQDNPDCAVLCELPKLYYTQPDELLVRAPADSEMAKYCKHYGIPFESLKEGEA